MAEDVRNALTALQSITEPWQPHRLVSVNDHDVKLARLDGEFAWHSHPNSDELFMVLTGELTLQLRDGDVVLHPHDVFVVPAGVEHNPRADTGASVLMVELKGTMNTGDTGGDRTSPLRELP